MSANEIHLNDIGTLFIFTIQESTSPVNLSSALVRQMLFKTPSGSILTKSASLVTDGTDGKIKYATVSGDLSVAGAWSLEAYVELTTGSWHSDISYFDVYPNVR